MSLLKLQYIMGSQIGRRSFFSRPPEPPADILINDPMKAIYVGTTKLFNIPFSWTFANLTNPHIAIVGVTGSGKSYFVKSFLLRASYIWNANAVIVDFAGEYKKWTVQSGGVVVSFGKGSYMNIMDLAGMRPLDRVKQIMNSLDILSDISNFPEQKRLSQEAIEQSYVNMGFGLAEKPPEGKKGPTLKNVISLLEEKLQEGTYEYPAELENAIYRLRQFAREGDDYFARDSTLDLGKLITSGLVDIDMSGLPDERFRTLAALFILQTLKEKMRAEGFSETKGLKLLVVLDEAWKVASDPRSDAITIIREGRKYQFGLIVASQEPTDINQDIFSNVGTTFILRTKFEKFLNYLQTSMNFSNFIRNEISNFGVGQAAVEMLFTSATRFPSTFIIDKIHGEEPLYVYTLDLTDILAPSEVSANIIQKDYQFEKEELRTKLIEFNISPENVEAIFTKMDAQSRSIKTRDFIQELRNAGVENTTIASFLKSIGLDDAIIARIMSKI
jgi:hypothetical protein